MPTNNNEINTVLELRMRKLESIIITLVILLINVNKGPIVLSEIWSGTFDKR